METSLPTQGIHLHFEQDWNPGSKYLGASSPCNHCDYQILFVTFLMGTSNV